MWSLECLIFSDLESTKSRSFRYRVVQKQNVVNIFHSGISHYSGLSHKVLCWQAGFPLSQRYFLLHLLFLIPETGAAGSRLGNCANTKERVLTEIRMMLPRLGAVTINVP